MKQLEREREHAECTCLKCTVKSCLIVSELMLRLAMSEVALDLAEDVKQVFG